MAISLNYRPCFTFFFEGQNSCLKFPKIVGILYNFSSPYESEVGSIVAELFSDMRQII
jgi:hypothetical protein